MAILMKTGDTAPIVQATLLDADSAPVDIAGATVRFVMATSPGGGAAVVDAAAVNAQVTTGADGTKGKVTYAWVAEDTATAGSYVAEFEVTFSDGSVQTFPTTGFLDCTISDDLGGTV